MHSMAHTHIYILTLGRSLRYSLPRKWTHFMLLNFIRTFPASPSKAFWTLCGFSFSSARWKLTVLVMESCLVTCIYLSIGLTAIRFPLHTLLFYVTLFAMKPNWRAPSLSRWFCSPCLDTWHAFKITWFFQQKMLRLNFNWNGHSFEHSIGSMVKSVQHIFSQRFVCHFIFFFSPVY